MNTAKIFQSGNSQAVRLPKKFRFAGERVYIKKFGSGILIEPEYPSNEEWLDELTKNPEDLFGNREQPMEADIREEL